MKQFAAFLLVSLALVGTAFARTGLKLPCQPYPSCLAPDSKASPLESQTKPTPFGFYAGMTRAQVIALVGKDGFKEPPEYPNLMKVNTSPIPNRTFESYLLIISPSQGLLKISAVGKDVTTGDDGSEVMSAFNTVVDALRTKYGAPTDKFNNCSGNDTECDDSQYFMLSLRHSIRTVAAYWGMNRHINGIASIAVKLHPASMNSGYVTVGYEFEGFEQYADQKTAEENNSY